MNTEDINHTMELQATPEEVYQTLLSSDKHSKLTGAPAQFDARKGGAFTTFNGAITGKIANLVENQKIELDWRADAFPEGHYTRVVFELEKLEEGTRITFTHEGIPAEALDMINKGWEMNYFENFVDHFS